MSEITRRGFVKGVALAPQETVSILCSRARGTTA
jgi:hypothetical protein